MSSLQRGDHEGNADALGVAGNAVYHPGGRKGRCGLQSERDLYPIQDLGKAFLRKRTEVRKQAYFPPNLHLVAERDRIFWQTAFACLKKDRSRVLQTLHIGCERHEDDGLVDGGQGIVSSDECRTHPSLFLSAGRSKVRDPNIATLVMWRPRTARGAARPSKSDSASARSSAASIVRVGRLEGFHIKDRARAGRADVAGQQAGCNTASIRPFGR